MCGHGGWPLRRPLTGAAAASHVTGVSRREPRGWTAALYGRSLLCQIGVRCRWRLLRSAHARALPVTSAGPRPGGGGMTWERLQRQRPGTPASCGRRRRREPGAALCAAGAAQPGYPRCYQCRRHLDGAPGMLADAVVPISYALKGGRMPRRCGCIRASRPERPPPGRRCGPSCSCSCTIMRRVSGARPPCRPRPGWPWCPAARGGPLRIHCWGCLLRRWRCARYRWRCGRVSIWGGNLIPGGSGPGPPLAGASVLLIDDTWVSGASAQSAVVALRAAGARHVAVVVLGRHIDPADPAHAGCVPAPAASVRSGPLRGPSGGCIP